MTFINQKLSCIVAFILLLSTTACDENEKPVSDPKPYVVMVSFDGFRHDYVENWDLPNFKSLISQGSKAEFLAPCFPSKTFPNHYSMVTGLYPGHHGLIDNSFYSAQKDATYRISDRSKVQDPDFYGGTPLWQHVQDYGMKSASFFWVGSEAPIKGNYPDYYEIYDGSVSNEERINQVSNWLKLSPANRPNFITLYFSLVDSEGHRSGPNSDQLGATVREADRLLGLLMNEIQQIDLPINLIITSDHGMYPVTYNRESVILMSEIGVDSEKGTLVSNGTHAHLYYTNIVDYNEQLDELKSDSRFTAHEKKNIPTEWYYDHEDIGDILLVANPGYQFRTSLPENLNGQDIGVHGYDPKSSEKLNGIFYAMGPNIKQGSNIPGFENIHIFPLVTKILNIPNPEIDGDPDILSPIFQEIEK